MNNVTPLGRNLKSSIGNQQGPPQISLALESNVWSNPAEAIEFLRLDALRMLPREGRAQLGQFFTPPPVAELMAAFITAPRPVVRILDPGAGVGSLVGTLVSVLARKKSPPREIFVTAVEMDTRLCDYLHIALKVCAQACNARGIRFEGKVVTEDFLAYAANRTGSGLFGDDATRFDCVILNPPYKKINVGSRERALLEARGMKSSNLYTAFLGLSVALLEPEGELVAITPRSFCNGPYFKDFRMFFLQRMALRDFHVFSSRGRAFEEDDVLQENVILSAIKRKACKTDIVRIHTSTDALSGDETVMDIPYTQVVRPGDLDSVIHIVADEVQLDVATRMHALPATLKGIGIEVSTGKVVDFRARQYLSQEQQSKTVPLLYPVNLREGAIAWPIKNGRKPLAIQDIPATKDLLVPADTYVLVKRFTSKEERRRLVASVFEPGDAPSDRIGFENHLNYFHGGSGGLPPMLARGLAVFLNSTFADEYFRQFNGHTQVNASDLRCLRYPSVPTLMALGADFERRKIDQKKVDAEVESKVFGMSLENEDSPSQAKMKIEEALKALKDLGLPREQQNDRSALTLLALLDLKPASKWSEATNPMKGITEMMDYFEKHYGKIYAPNTRETVRRFTVHQFSQAGLCIANPDEPERPVNSPDFVYQIPTRVLPLFRAFGSDGWRPLLQKHLKNIGSLRKRYARERKMQKIPVHLPSERDITLSPGEHNELIKMLLDDFCPRFVPGAEIIYIGDTEDKWACFNKDALNALGVIVGEHGKMPDVVVYYKDKNWLVLIEAVTSHGPVNPKRREELSQLFKNSKAGLVYVTAFLTRKAMVKYLNDISWETDVWVAEAPSHLIHFDGKCFLGPYEG